MQGELFPERYVREMANQCEKLLFSDRDGLTAIDYLEDGIRSICAGAHGGQHAVANATDFVRSEFERFERCKDAKLLARYEQVVWYFESRLGQEL